MDGLVVMAIVIGCFWFVVTGGGDPKRDQKRQKLIRESRKQWKAQHNG